MCNDRHVQRLHAAGLGVIKLAQHSGRPIYAVAIASSRRIELDNWDGSAINLPFGRIGIVAKRGIFVPYDSDRAALGGETTDRTSSTGSQHALTRSPTKPGAANLERQVADCFADVSAAVRGGEPFAPILLARRLKRGKEHRQRLPERRGESRIARAGRSSCLGTRRSVGNSRAFCL
jgi:hypothetical protein